MLYNSFKTKKELLILLVVGQLFMSFLLNSSSLHIPQIFDVTYYSAVIINFVLYVFSLIIIINILNLSKKEQELNILKREQLHIESLSLFLRELRHDINNQLFVVEGFLQLGKVEEATAYSVEIRDQFDWMDRLLKLNQPEFATLVLNKLISAKNQDIVIEVNIKECSLDNISRDVLLRSVGNLLDNAVEALLSHHGKEKKLGLEIFCSEDNLIISVFNSGEIPQEIASKIFERGFSTKKDKAEHGLGLHIVKSLMESIDGKITNSNKDGMTTFQLLFPCKD